MLKGLIGKKIGNNGKNGAQVELLLLRKLDQDIWEVLAKPGRRLAKGAKLLFGKGQLSAEVRDDTKFGGKIVKFFYEGIFQDHLEELGKIPLPPYIHNHKEVSPQDYLAERYQTVYADVTGSAAAPTAGLHFTEELLKDLAENGIQQAFVTLHTGLGTFRPIDKADIREHQIHEEWYTVGAKTIEQIRQTKLKGGRVIAVGTTSTRVLETIQGVILGKDKPTEQSGFTNIFIYPGYKFKIIDGLITNFHLPKSSLLVLAAAFAGRDFILRAYQEAIRQKYRFFSFGDALLIH